MNIINNKFVNFITIGNDVVNISLEKLKNKHLDLRFINRVLANSEKDLLDLSENKEIVLWMLWSAKEAAFKAYQKIKYDLIFSPIKFVVGLDVKSIDRQLYLKNNDANFSLNIKGFIKIYNVTIQAIWNINSRCVHCVALLLENDFLSINEQADCLQLINYKIFDIDSSSYYKESLDTKLKAKQYLVTQGLPAEIEIKRSLIIVNGTEKIGPPKLFIKEKVYNYEISLSHDNGLGAIAYFKPFKTLLI